jgi:thiamine-monophosphate kinase
MARRTSGPRPGRSDNATPALLGEEAIIQRHMAPLAAGFAGAFGLTDDCATLTPTPGHDLVLKTDAIAEGVHFLPDDPPEDVGWKALAVNVSDLAAKGAVPRVYLLSLAFPEAPTAAWMEAFTRGLGEAQAAFAIHLAGGDTDRRPGPVAITPMVVGEVATGTMLRRGGARAGDHVYVSGTLGDAALGLALRLEPALAAAWGPTPDEAAHLVSRYRRPRPRLALRAALRAHASGAMDISDGLLKDLDRMCRASGVAARIEAAIVPLSPAAARVLAAEPARLAAILAGGDDYEVLASVPSASAAKFEQMAIAAGCPVTCIGRFEVAGEAPAVTVAGPDGAPLVAASAGYDHFGTRPADR